MRNLAKKTYPDRVMLGASAVLSSYYWSNSENITAPLVGVKVNSSGLLPLFVIYKSHQAGTLRKNWALIVSLILHSIGDGAIESPKYPIMLALPVFFFAHIAYAIKLNDTRIPMKKINTPQGMALGFITMFAAWFTNLLLMSKADKEIKYAIPFYVVAISLMLMMACLQKENPISTTFRALSYVTSDIIIAINNFVNPIKNATSYTWPTYFGSQFWTAVAAVQNDISEKEQATLIFK